MRRRGFTARKGLRAACLLAAVLLVPYVAYHAWTWITIGREDVRFPSGELVLAGTLWKPRFAENPPGVVLIHGSGPVRGDDMAWFARRFVKNGVAALVYDKRGVGDSEGNPEAWRQFDFADLAADAAAAFRFLSARGDIDGGRVGFFAASQGGWVAPLAAAQCQDARFLILISPSVSTVAEDRLFERGARLRMEGFTPEECAEVLDMHHVDNEVTRSGGRFEEYCALWETHREKRWFRRVYLSEEPMAPDDPYRTWERTILDFDPVAVLQELDVPALWLFGDPRHDRFGPVELSLERLEALRASGKDYEVWTFRGADHDLDLVESGWIGRLLNRPAPWQRPFAAWLDRTLQPKAG